MNDVRVVDFIFNITMNQLSTVFCNALLLIGCGMILSGLIEGAFYWWMTRKRK